MRIETLPGPRVVGLSSKRSVGKSDGIPMGMDFPQNGVAGKIVEC